MAPEATREDDGLTARADALCRALGYVGRPTFYDRRSAFERIENRHVVDTAFGGVGIHSVFGLSEGASPGSFKPTVYVGCARTDADADAFHRRAWTQGAVPLLLVVRPGGVEIRDGFSPPTGTATLLPFARGEEPHPDLDAVGARALTNSLHWRDRPVSRASAIDARLVAAIDDLNRVACESHPELKARRGLVNALIGRLIYLYVLIDRGIVRPEWMRRTIEAAGCAGTGFAEDAVRQGARPRETPFGADEVWAVLRGVDRLINGSVFAITRKGRSELPSGLLHTMHRVLRCADVATVEGRQVSFLDVSFEVLRTETISAIYEHFVRSEDAGLQKAEGVYYTPPFVADYVLSEVEREVPLHTDSRVLDCTAGSGVFLVSAYRRIMERATPPGGWGPAHARAARDILTTCIHGIEKNPQAANVCRFSLYLTMLDYVGQDGIEELASRFPRSPREKLLPRLRRNVMAGNAFDPRLAPGKFTHVIGNPPWAQTGRGRYDRNSGEVTVRREVAEDPDRAAFVATLEAHERTAHGRLSDLLTWAAVRRLADDGVLGLVLPTNSFVGRQSGAFGAALAEKTSVRLVANLSHLRYHLFVGAKAAATVVVTRNAPPSPRDVVTVYRPRLPSLPLGSSKDVWSLLASQTDLHVVRSRDLSRGHNGWFKAVALGPYDRRLREALGTWAADGDRTVGGFLRRSGLRIRRGGSPAETGLPAPQRRTPVGRTKSREPTLLPLDEKTFSGLPANFRSLFRAGSILVPRTLRGLRLLDEPYAFTSTYNAIVPSGTDMAATSPREAWRLANATVTGTRRQALLGLMAFLRSDVVGYFATIYGANTQVEDARFEQGDLAVMPCPFADLADPRLADLSSAQDVNGAILEAMNAGADLRAAVDEHEAFNRGYLDGKTPAGAYDPAPRDQIDRFATRFERELRALFTAANLPRVTVEEHDAGFVSLGIAFGENAHRHRGKEPEADGVFVAASVVNFDPLTRQGSVLKSRARFAWMSDQAVADADAVARVVREARRA